MLQVGCGQKRFCDEMNDGATDEVSDNYFTVTNVTQVKIKQFRITGVDHTVQKGEKKGSLSTKSYCFWSEILLLQYCFACIN